MHLAQKKSVLIAVGGLLIGSTAMLVTNPGKSAYVDYAYERLSKEFKQDCSEFKDKIHLGPILKLPTRDLCKSFLGSADLVGRGAMKQVIDVSTQRKNLGFFSIYNTKLLGRTFKTVGGNLDGMAEAVSTEQTSAANFDFEALMAEAAELRGQQLVMGDLVKLKLASQLNYEDLPDKVRAKVDAVREAASPKFQPDAIASQLLNQWRQQRQQQQATAAA